jgi:hypothetical protein
MKYKEILFFIAKCLTITLEEKNQKEIEHQLKTAEIDWDTVVKVSTENYVFPALYCNLKRAKFLQYLPNDLVEYMQYITDLNRIRNKQIIKQAKEVNQLLLENNITPIFLKGTGNLLEGLYQDIAERMVGDIDFIFSKEDYTKAIELLDNNTYSKVHKRTYYYPSFKHYPRLKKENRIAAVEIHKELLVEEYSNEFNYTIIKKDTQKINNVSVMSFQNQLALSIIATQINDKGFYYKNILLRNAYDVFLLSKRTNAKVAFDEFNKLKNPLNCFLASSFEVFNQPESLRYSITSEITTYLKTFNAQLNDAVLRNKRNKRTEKKLFIKSRLQIIYKSIFDREHRTWLLKRISDKQWHSEKLIQLGLKRAKS